MLRLLYTAALSVAAPFAALATSLRGLRDPAYRDRIGERFGFARARFERPPIWVHAVSVGEVQAAAVLIRALHARYPEHPLLVTTATPTGAQRVATLFANIAVHAYLPYDTPGSVRRFLDRAQPRIAIVMEREIWPNLFEQCRRRRIPVVMASARVSASSAERHRQLRSLFAPALRSVTVAAQTDADAARYRAMGATQVEVMGNLKFDLDVPADLIDVAMHLRQTQFANRLIWVAGSTHEGEEDIVLDAHAELRKKFADALLILAPRHPNRFATVADRLTARGIAFVRASDQKSLRPEDAVYLLDAMGALLMHFAIGHVAFVGGSLAPIGGHSLLEPAALARPVLTGPHNFNAQDVADLMLAADAAILVEDAPSLAGQVAELFGNTNRRLAMGARAAGVVASNKGALQRLLRVIEPQISE